MKHLHRPLGRACASSSRSRPGVWFRPTLELLEERTNPTPYTLTTGVGDGNVTVGVDGFGAFGTAVGVNGRDAIYDPIGATAAAGTSYVSALALRIGPTGSRNFLASGSVGFSGGLPNPVVAGTSISGTSTFVNSGLSFRLVQTVAPTFNGATRTGSVLTQTYTITNMTAGALTFELVRYMDGWLRFDGSLIDGGGRIGGTPEVLFETDDGATSTTSTTFVGTTAVGGTPLASNRYTFDDYNTVMNDVETGGVLDNIIQGDGNGDGFIDSPYDPARAFRNVFTLAPAASTIYTTTTIFGNGTPASVFPGVIISPTAASLNVAEGGAGDTYTIVLSVRPTSAVTIKPTANSQLTRNPANIVFTPSNWATPRTVTVKAVDDSLVEGLHTGTISHTITSNDSFYRGLTLATLTATITDNDSGGINIGGAPVNVAEGGVTGSYTVSLKVAPSSNVTLDLASSAQVNVSPASLVFTPANWSTPQNVTVTAVDDPVIEGNHSAVITTTATSADSAYNGRSLPTVAVRIADNDFRGSLILTPVGASQIFEGGSTSYTVELSKAPTADVAVTINPGAQLATLQATLTFTPADWNIPQTVDITALDDVVAQGDRTAGVSQVATSFDPAFLRVNATMPIGISDDEVAGLILTPDTLDLAEGGPSGTYTVELSCEPVANVIVTLDKNAEVFATPSVLTFTPGNWNVPQPISVKAADDPRIDGAQAITLDNSTFSTSQVYNNLVASTVVNITDNDFAQVIVEQPSSPYVLENNVKIYTVVLNAPPRGADVIVTPSPDTQLAVFPASLTFNQYDWNLPRTVTVTALDDSDVQGTHSAMISHSSSSADFNFDSLPIDDVNLQIVDDEGSAVNGGTGSDQILVTFWGGQSQISVAINGKTTFLPNSLTQLVIVAGAGNDNIQVVRPTVPVVILGGLGKDTLTVTGLDSGNDFVLDGSSVLTNGAPVDVWGVESLIVSGRAGQDVYTVLNVPTFSVEFKGEAGVDQVIGPDIANTWAITANDAGTLNKTVLLTAIESLTGGLDADRFLFSAGKFVTGQVDGGTGYDVLDYSLYTTPAVVNLNTGQATATAGFQNIAKMRGGKGSDKLIGVDQSNQWNITGLNFGDVGGSFAFEGVENLTGGLQDDTYLFGNLASVTGKIDGGAGSDFVDFSAYLSKSITVNLQTLTATNTGGWLAIEQFAAGGSAADILIGANRANDWHVTDRNTGDINGLQFASFENLTGGIMSDRFDIDAFGYWTGTLQGGTGNDTLLSTNLLFRNWVMTSATAGTLNGWRFNTIETRL